LQVQAILIKKVIRTVMKNRGLTYEDLAVHLDVSHSTIKRALTSEELSLGRLLAICEWLQMSLSELDVMVKDFAAQTRTQFTEEQELFLATHPNCLRYLVLLLNGKTPGEIEAMYKLDARSTDLYLRKLEQNDLIRVSAKNAVVPVHPHMPRWHLGGPLFREYHAQLNGRFGAFFREYLTQIQKEKTEDPPYKQKGFCQSMTKDAFVSFKKEMELLIEKYIDVGHVQEKFYGTKGTGGTVFTMEMCWVPDAETLKDFENIFGEITSIDE
jgi:transcriptional regulator with XRE-family HTH domain